MLKGAAVRQGALTVVAQVRRGERDALQAALVASDEGVRARMGAVETLHFGRFVVFDDAFGDRALLAFESNYDGERAEHVQRLEAVLGADLCLFFGFCEEFRAAELERFFTDHAVQAATFYLGHPGLSVAQIRADRAMRAAIEALLDAEDRGGALAGVSALAIKDRVLAHLRDSGLEPRHVDRGLPRAPLKWARLLGAAAGPLVKLLLMAPFAPGKEKGDAALEAVHPPELVPEDSDALDALFAREDHAPQNGMTAVVPVKDGCYRWEAVTSALAFIEALRRWEYFNGKLGGLSTIHFARWCALDDGSLLFMSNYDGSWESYLGDFVDKVAWGLSLVWSNTKWFPRTRFFLQGGAREELRFKRWVRTFQVPNAIWYSAYPDLSVDNVLDNAKLRELAAAGLETEEAARAWLAML